MKKLSLLNKLVYLVNSVFLSSLLISYLAPYIDPKFGWPISFLGLLFPILYIVNLCFLIYWLIQFKRPLLANIIILLFGLQHIGNFIGIVKKKSEKEERETIKIMSYNVRIFNTYEWIPKKNVKKEILEFFKKEKADILCIQEFYAAEKLPDLQYNYKHVGSKKQQNNNSNLAIYSKFPQINKASIEIKDNSIKNTCIFSDIIIKKDTIRVYNIHLASNWFKPSNYSFIENPTLKKGILKENIQDIINSMKISYKIRAKQVKRIEKHMRNCPYPIIICGDFNDTPLSFSYHTLANGLIDSFERAGRGIGNSYTKIPFLRIDYILHDSFFRTIKYKKHREILSDHYPISSELKISTSL